MDFTKKRLERAGYFVCCAGGLVEARKECGDRKPDGILVESELPDGKGFDFCREVRNECAVPIMFLSHDKNDELQALRAGANDFLKKPCDYEILLARIDVMLKERPKGGVLFPDDFGDKPQTGDDTMTPAAETAAGEEETAEPEPDEPDESAKRNARHFIRRLYAFAAACFVMMIGAAGVFLMTSKPPEEFLIEDEGVPLAEAPVRGTKHLHELTITMMGIKIPKFGDITIPSDSANVYIFLPNPEDNSCLLGYEIFLEDTDETIYLSEMIAPGECEENLTLARGLAKGEYGAVIKAVAYASKDLAVVEELEIPLRITAN